MDSHRIQACRKFKALPLADRLEIAKRKGLCFRCLNWGHMSKDCDATCSLCGRRHHDQLHDPERERAPQESNQAQVLTAMVSKAEVKKVPSTDDAGSDEEEIQASEAQVWMCLLPVIVHGKNADVTTYAFMDSGSNSTLMTRGLFQQLGLEGHPIDYSIRTLNDKQGPQFEGIVDISSIDRKESATLRVSTVFWLPIPLNSPKGDMKKWKHLQDIEVATVGQAEVGLLIGMDCPELHWSLEEIRGGRGEPYAKKTIFGWTIVGPTIKKPLTLWSGEPQAT